MALEAQSWSYWRGKAGWPVIKIVKCSKKGSFNLKDEAIISLPSENSQEREKEYFAPTPGIVKIAKKLL